MRKTTMAINIDNQTKEICALLRNGISAEEIANQLSSALQAAEKQIATEKQNSQEKLKSDLCDCLRNYMGAAHPKIYNKMIEIHESDFTDEELIGVIDNAIKNTATVLNLYESFVNLYGSETSTSEYTNWKKLFNDFFDKYNL